MNKPNSPRVASALSACVKMIVKLPLLLALAVGWALATLGAPMFSAGMNLETWARKKLRALAK